MSRQTKQERHHQLLAQAVSDGLWDFQGEDKQTYEVCYTCVGTGITQGTSNKCVKCAGSGCRLSKPAPPKFDVDKAVFPKAAWGNTRYGS